MSTQTATTTRKPNVPPAVAAAAARAEELIRQNNQPAEPPAEEPKVEAKTEEVTPEVTKTEEVTQQITEQPKVEETKPKDVDWEHRYNSMKGRHDRLEEQNRQLADEISSLRQVIATLKVQNPPKVDAKPTEPQKPLITKEEEEEFGPELVDLIGRKAMEVARNMTAEQQAKIQELEARLGNVGEHIGATTRNQMFSTLESSVPNWRELNTDPKFISWLRLPDVYSGDIRQNMLNAAFEANDGHRVAAFFKGFLAEEAAMAPAAKQAAPADDEDRTPLEELAAPGRAKTAATSAVPAEKPIFTSAQISAFYTDVANGKYRGRDSEREKMEKAIFKAQREGRIRAM